MELDWLDVTLLVSSSDVRRLVPYSDDAEDDVLSAWSACPIDPVVGAGIASAEKVPLPR